MNDIKDALTFDDVLLTPQYSNVLPSDVCIKTKLTKNFNLNIPVLAAAMDTISEANMGITMAQLGGLAVIHKNFSIEKQANEIKKIKRFEAGIVLNPITIPPSCSVGEAIQIMVKNSISSIPVIAKRSKKIKGILTNRDVRFITNLSQDVGDIMTKKLITCSRNVTTSQAKKLLHKHRIEKLLVVDKNNKLVGLITVKDIEKSSLYPNALKDKSGRLVAAAAVGAGEKAIERTKVLVDAGVDIIVVDTAHGHSQLVIDTVKTIKKDFKVDVIAGNIATPSAFKQLIEMGADAVKVGIGPGSICTTRMIAGVGVPQLSAIMECSKIANEANIPLIADGGIKYSGDIAKAFAGGANSVMIGSLLAGTQETPGDVFLYQGRSYKSYRGMGSQGAMSSGSADRYFQDNINNRKFVPEGIEGRVPFKGKVSDVIYQLLGGLRSSMGYTGCKNIEELRKNGKFRKITNAGLSESHVHDVTITKEAPNYHK